MCQILKQDFLLLPSTLKSLNLTPFWTYYCSGILRFFYSVFKFEVNQTHFVTVGCVIWYLQSLENRVQIVLVFWQPLLKHANSASLDRDVLSICVCVWTGLSWFELNSSCSGSMTTRSLFSWWIPNCCLFRWRTYIKTIVNEQGIMF